jgi:hypothetical protein
MEVHILVDQYRVVVGGIGIVFESESLAEAKRQYRLYVSQSDGESVALFKDYEIVREYNPADLSRDSERTKDRVCPIRRPRRSAVESKYGLLSH